MKVIYDISYILNGGLIDPRDEVYINFLEVPIKCKDRITNVSMLLVSRRNFCDISIFDKFLRVPLDRVKFFVIFEEVCILSIILKVKTEEILDYLRKISNKVGVRFEVIRLGVDTRKIIDLISTYSLHERKKRKNKRIVEKDIITALNDVVILLFSKKFGLKVKSMDKRVARLFNN